MVLQKEDIWERLKTASVWVEHSAAGVDPPTALFSAIAERQFRYVVGIWISGNMQVTTGLSLYKLEEDDSYTPKFSPIPVAPADFRQIPKGSYSITDPILTFEGDTGLYGKTDVAGMSLNVTVDYWDWDV